MPDSLTLDGSVYTRVPRERADSTPTADVYHGDLGYMRIGTPEVVQRAIRRHAEMKLLGFPVADIVGQGEYDGRAFYIEESLGDKSFMRIFLEDTQCDGGVSDEHFDQFVSVTERFLIAQLKTVETQRYPEEFAKGIHLGILREDLPQYEMSLKMKFESVCERLAPYPYVLSHGDYNPSNIFQKGVIDLEDSFRAPLGFDAVSALITTEWFPLEAGYESISRYRFSDEQRARYLAMCDRVFGEAGIRSVRRAFEQFEFCRAVWLSARMKNWPKMQAWRFQRFIKTYLFW